MTNKVNRNRQSGGGDNCQNKYRKGCSARLCYALPDCICFSQLLAHMYTDNNTHMYTEKNSSIIESCNTIVSIDIKNTKNTICILYLMFYLFGFCICICLWWPLHLYAGNKSTLSVPSVRHHHWPVEHHQATSQRQQDCICICWQLYLYLSMFFHFPFLNCPFCISILLMVVRLTFHLPRPQASRKRQWGSFVNQTKLDQWGKFLDLKPFLHIFFSLFEIVKSSLLSSNEQELLRSDSVNPNCWKIRSCLRSIGIKVSFYPLLWKRAVTLFYSKRSNG